MKYRERLNTRRQLIIQKTSKNSLLDLILNLGILFSQKIFKFENRSTPVLLILHYIKHT